MKKANLFERLLSTSKLIKIQLSNGKKRIEIKRTRPRKPSKVDDDALRADVEQYPDDYQYERAARFGCGISTIGDALKGLNITVKKTLLHPKAKTELREQYLKDLNRLRYQHPIIYLDESGFKSHEHRPQGYSKQGNPCYGTYNWQWLCCTNLSLKAYSTI